MKCTENWLKEYVATDLSAEEIAARLTMLGLEVDAVESLAAGLDGVCVARVVEVVRHPNADRLSLCQVDDGSGTLRPVVCGAPNVRPGLFTSLALPGAVLPGDFKIKKSKIRGEVSEGMLCAERELGLAAPGTDSGGIMELDPAQFPRMRPGMPLAELLGLNDAMIEVDLTPNRPDCTAVVGLAREVAGAAGLPLRRPQVKLVELAGGPDLPFQIKVEAPDCRRYSARLLRGVKIGPSPWWLRQRLLAVGLRPINNVVDVTNYVMMELGQPLHAFDFDRLAGGMIRVRKAAAGEKITTLDGVERELASEMLVIADEQRAMAVAGIMGGAESEVSGATVNILLESACFEATSVRRTAAALKLTTDSSYRFERGVDPQLAPVALARALELMLALAGGQAVPGGVDYRDGIAAPPVLRLRLSRVNNLLGTELDLAAVEKCLAGIEIKGRRLDEQTLEIQPPSFRVDLEREIDLVEEVARLIGYDRIPTAMPTVTMTLPATEVGERRERLKHLLTAAGCHEAINYSFVNPAHADWLQLTAADPRRVTLPLLNPLSEEQGVMRTSLLPGLLENARHNINHQSLDLRLFELGKVFQPVAGEELPREEERLTVVFSGRRLPGAPLLWEGEAQVDLLDLKGVLEELLAGLRLAECRLAAASQSAPYAVPGTTLALFCGEEQLGECGKFRPEVLKAFGIKQEVFYLDLSCDRLLALPAPLPAFRELPRFPAVKWDLAVLVPEATPAGELLAAVYEAGGKLLERAEIFDVYRGKNIEKGRKSVAFAIHYRDSEGTLQEEKVAVVHQKIIDLLVSRFHGQLREA